MTKFILKIQIMLQHPFLFVGEKLGLDESSTKRKRSTEDLSSKRRRSSETASKTLERSSSKRKHSPPNNTPAKRHQSLNAVDKEMPTSEKDTAERKSEILSNEKLVYIEPSCICPVEACQNKTFIGVAAMKQHWQFIHGTFLQYLCLFCKTTTFPSTCELKEHYQSAHYDKGIPQTLVSKSHTKLNKAYVDPGIYRLKNSSTQDSKDQEENKKEMVVKKNGLDYVDPSFCTCPVLECKDNTFASIHDTKRHWAEVHEELVMCHMCSFCPGVNFRQTFMLRDHYEETHSDKEDIQKLLSCSDMKRLPNKSYINPGKYRLLKDTEMKTDTEKGTMFTTAGLFGKNSYPRQQPLCIIIRGLPGAGKSHMAKVLMVGTYF